MYKKPIFLISFVVVLGLLSGFAQAGVIVAENLLVDLQRNGKYRVVGIDDEEKELVASPEGTLRFVTTGSGAIKLIPANKKE